MSLRCVSFMSGYVAMRKVQTLVWQLKDMDLQMTNQEFQRTPLPCSFITTFCIGSHWSETDILMLVYFVVTCSCLCKQPVPLLSKYLLKQFLYFFAQFRQLLSFSWICRTQSQPVVLWYPFPISSSPSLSSHPRQGEPRNQLLPYSPSSVPLPNEGHVLSTKTSLLPPVLCSPPHLFLISLHTHFMF